MNLSEKGSFTEGSSPDALLEASFMQEAATLAGQLESPASLSFLHRNFPAAVPSLAEAANLEQPQERVKALNGLVQEFLAQLKSHSSTPERDEVVKSIGGLAGIGMQVARKKELSLQFAELINELKRKNSLAEDESRKTHEAFEQEIDKFLERSEPVDYGMQSVVFRMDLNNEPEDFRTGLSEEGADENVESTALKVLKIYKQGTASAEYSRQQQAYNLLRKKPANGEPVATVPKPFLVRDVAISQSVRSKLESRHCSLPEGRAEILMMDFVEGKDFQYYILSKALVLRGHDRSVEAFDSHQLYELASTEFNFVVIVPGSSPHERWQARVKNMSSIYHYLKGQGVKINPNVVAQLKNSLKIFEKEGFIHGDLHERNLMYSGSMDSFFSEAKGPQEEVSIIDFGPFPPEEADSLTTENDKVVYNNLSFLNS